eukprot:GILK01010019.1.p2 GENE.GILK01010019.1~~GILK01010019.1.p2  ORF type:complete len:128 (+),score=8.19 GILK01010019.1:49-432(+)
MAYLVSQAATTVFCPDCGSLLSTGLSDTVSCKLCGYSCRSEVYEQQQIVTTSRPTGRKLWLDKALGKLDDELAKQTITRATVKQACPAPKCTGKKLSFYTMQLRSADEGQTVFYECLKCGHKYSVNT